MRSTRTAPVRRRRALLTLTPLVLLLPLLAPTTAAQGAPPPPPPVISVVVTDIASTVTPPKTDGSPLDFLAKDTPFSLSVEFVSGPSTARVRTPISETKPVTLTVSVVGAKSTLGPTTTVTVAKGATTATFPALTLTKAANAVQLLVTATAPAKDTAGVLPGLSPVFDVARDFDSRGGFVGKEGALVSREGLKECTATPERRTCVDLILPASTTPGDAPSGNGDVAFFSTGVCDAAVGCQADRIDERDVLQVLARWNLDRDNPATLIVKCDKTLCEGGAIRSNVLKVSVNATGLLKDADPCETKGVVNAGVDFCVDYVQSRRDGSGDTYLYLLMIRDARMSI